MPGSATLVFVASAADVDHVAFAPSIIYPSIDDLVLALGARVARVVLPLVRGHHGVLSRVGAVGNDQTGSEEGPHGLEERSVELLEGGEAEERHDGGLFCIGSGKIQLRVIWRAVML